MGIAITDTGTTQVMPLGFEFHEPASGDDQGEKVWIYVEASEALVIGSVCSYAAAATTVKVRKVPANTHAGTILGVAQHVIAINAFGFILRRGVGEVLADSGGTTANLGLIAGDAVGTADAAAAVTDASFGVAQEAVASGLATCWINCQG
tara:strand:- start:541 stop:990 length:450 start_codon:yes stop_codon:yes gene_type:complete